MKKHTKSNVDPIAAHSAALAHANDAQRAANDLETELSQKYSPRPIPNADRVQIIRARRTARLASYDEECAREPASRAISAEAIADGDPLESAADVAAFVADLRALLAARDASTFDEAGAFTARAECRIMVHNAAKQQLVARRRAARLPVPSTWPARPQGDARAYLSVLEAWLASPPPVPPAPDISFLDAEERDLLVAIGREVERAEEKKARDEEWDRRAREQANDEARMQVAREAAAMQRHEADREELAELARLGESSLR